MDKIFHEIARPFKKFNDSKGQQQEITTWHNVNFFNKLSEIASKYAHVGNLIYIEGEIVNKKVDENWYYSVTGRDLKLLPSSKRDNNQDEPKQNNGSKQQNWDIPDDGIPF